MSQSALTRRFRPSHRRSSAAWCTQSVSSTHISVSSSPLTALRTGTCRRGPFFFRGPAQRPCNRKTLYFHLTILFFQPFPAFQAFPSPFVFNTPSFNTPLFFFYPPPFLTPHLFLFTLHLFFSGGLAGLWGWVGFVQAGLSGSGFV